VTAEIVSAALHTVTRSTVVTAGEAECAFAEKAERECWHATQPPPGKVFIDVRGIPVSECEPYLYKESLGYRRAVRNQL